jgi:hypothetical protein
MDEPALTEAVKTDLPSPRPNRRRRLALRFAAFVVAASALGATYWFTRPPELVWWRSPPIGSASRRVQVLIPNGWDGVRASRERWQRNNWTTQYAIFAVDRMPGFLRRIFPRKTEEASLEITVIQNGTIAVSDYKSEIQRIDYPDSQYLAKRDIYSGNEKIAVAIYYSRSELPAFNRTYRQICNSLRIE